MKKSKRAKNREIGLRFQRWIRKYLIEEGWDCVNIPPRSFPVRPKNKKEPLKFVSLRNDIFGCDLIARKKTAVGFKELWIQATTDSHVDRKLKKIAEHPLPFSSEVVDTQIWVKAEKAVNIFQVTQDEKGELKADLIAKIIRGKRYNLSRADKNIKFKDSINGNG